MPDSNSQGLLYSPHSEDRHVRSTASGIVHISRGNPHDRILSFRTSSWDNKIPRYLSACCFPICNICYWMDKTNSQMSYRSSHTGFGLLGALARVYCRVQSLQDIQVASNYFEATYVPHSHIHRSMILLYHPFSRLLGDHTFCSD